MRKYNPRWWKSRKQIRQDYREDCERWLKVMSTMQDLSGIAIAVHYMAVDEPKWIN